MAGSAALSYEQAPPFSLPVRFFLSAPLFVTAAGVLVMVVGDEIFASRWMPATLALTHLLTVGFMLMVMLGGLLQVLPVVMGVRLVAARSMGSIVHLLLFAGAVVLPLAFLVGKPLLFQSAALLLGVAVLLFLLSAWRSLLALADSSPSIVGIRCSLLGLAVAVGLGVIMAAGLGRGWALPYLALTDLHAAWGLAAWGGMLLAALSYLVVPMFQMTPPYATRFSAWMLGTVFAGVLLWSLGVWGEAALAVALAGLLLALAGGSYAGHSLQLFARRRRARRDATFWFWQSGLVSALLAVLMLPLALLLPELAAHRAWALTFGLLLGIGGFMSVMTGMLYKIVPFLAWLHLQDLGRARRKVPSMVALLPEARMKRQLALHLASLAGMLLAAGWPALLAWPAGLLLAASGLALFANLAGVAFAYRRATAQLDAGNINKTEQSAPG